MSDELPKARTGVGRTQTMPPNSGSVALDRAVLKVGARIRAKYQEPLSDRKKAERAVRLFRAALIPRRRPGRKLSESVMIAIEQRAAGKDWNNAFAAAIPGYRALDKYERLLRCANLRRNVAKALKRKVAAQRKERYEPIQSPEK